MSEISTSGQKSHQYFIKLGSIMALLIMSVTWNPLSTYQSILWPCFQVQLDKTKTCKWQTNITNTKQHEERSDRWLTACHCKATSVTRTLRVNPEVYWTENPLGFVSHLWEDLNISVNYIFSLISLPSKGFSEEVSINCVKRQIDKIMKTNHFII